MIHHRLLLGLCLLASPISAPAGETIELGDDLSVEAIAPHVWRHLSWQQLEGWGRTPANGLLVVDDGGIALIDTPWTDDQTERLLAWAEETLGARPKLVVPTHAHPDNLGGLAAARRRGAVAWALPRTAAAAEAAGSPVDRVGEGDPFVLELGETRLELHHPGPGHTPDNFVVWIPGERLLFGGCFVKSASSRTMGYTGEASGCRFSVRAVLWIIAGHEIHHRGVLAERYLGRR